MADQAVLLERRDDALDPIRALDRWLAVRGDADGPLFTNLHHRGPGRKAAGDHLPAGNIRVIVQDLASSVGLPSTVSGYSLRRSWATHRYLADPHDLASITMQLRHASMDMTVRYVEDLRPGDLNGDDILSTDQVLASAGGQPVGRKDIGFDPAPLADLVAEATVLSSPQASVAPSTARVNDSLWATWSVWTREQGFSPMPATAEALALFIAARADKGLKPGSLRAQLRQIVREHATLGYPTIGLASLAEEILDAYSRTHTAGPRKAPVLPIEDLTAMATAAAGLGPGGLRDRVIVCAGYCGAMRVDDGPGSARGRRGDAVGGGAAATGVQGQPDGRGGRDGRAAPPERRARPDRRHRVGLGAAGPGRGRLRPFSQVGQLRLPAGGHLPRSEVAGDADRAFPAPVVGDARL